MAARRNAGPIPAASARRAVAAAADTPATRRRRGRSPSRRPDGPAGRSSRARSTATVAGAIRLRRRLSRIFQRDMSGRRLRCRPVAGRHERKEPPQDLPVAAHPAVLASRVREDARRIVVDDLDVGDEGRARVEALEEVVRQQRVLRHAALERRDERVDVVEALAGEDAFVEEILVDVRDGGRVRIHAGVAGVGAGEQRSGRARHRDADPRLQNPVALRDAADARVEARTVQRMRDDADRAAFAASRGRRVSVSSVMQ